MKKAIVGLGILGIFILYSLSIRSHHTAVGKAGELQVSPSNKSVSKTSNSYKNGTYSGSVADAFYGNVQVSVVIAEGKITAVNFLQYPDSEPNSVSVNQQAMPQLQQEAIQNQTANVQTITGASDTSVAFRQSLTTALSQAKA